jgi:hypothetical protein
LDNSAKANAENKAMIRHGTHFSLNTSGLQIADPSNSEAETTSFEERFGETRISKSTPAATAASAAARRLSEASNPTEATVAAADSAAKEAAVESAPAAVMGGISVLLIA